MTTLHLTVASVRRGARSRGAALCLFLAVVCALLPYAAQADNGGEGGVIATDSHMGRVYMAQPHSNHVFVLSVDGSQLIDVLSVPPAPTALAVDARHGLLYVASDAAGTITRFDATTDHATRTYRVPGHPAGLAVVDGGRTLLVTDASGGTLRALAVGSFSTRGATRSGPLSVQDRLVLGPSVAPSVLLAPQRTWIGGSPIVWARGFTAGEPVEVSWGIQPLAQWPADPAGEVTGRIVVPAHIALGDHLLILQGQWSKRAESALVTVVAAPPPPKRPKRIAPTAHRPLWESVLAPSVTLVMPAPLWKLVQRVSPATTAVPVPVAPHGKTRSAKTKAPVKPAHSMIAFHPQRDIHVPVVLFALPFLVVALYLVRLLLRARRRRSAKRAKAAPVVAAPTTAAPARASSAR